MALDVSFARRGESVTYEDEQGNQTVLSNVVWIPRGRDPELDSSGADMAERAEMLVMSDTLTAAGVTISEDGNVIRGSKTWSVAVVPDVHGGFYRVRLARSEIDERTRQGYRYGR